PGIVLFVCSLVVSLSTHSSHAQSFDSRQGAQHAIVLGGTIVDAKTGEGIAKALVSIRERSLNTVTDQNGAFHFAAVAPGDSELHVGRIEYNHHKHRLPVSGDRDGEVEIQLGQKPPRPGKIVTEKADALEPVQPGIASSETLD